MASSKEIQHASRPIGQHRVSISGSSGASLPGRPTHSRNHSHSVSAGSFNPSRVSRRKSISTNATNVAAVAEAVREAGDRSFAMAMPSARRNTNSRGGVSKSFGNPTPPNSFPINRLSLMNHRRSEKGESAIEDDQDDEMGDDENDGINKSHARRASDGQHLKGDKKASHNDLRCSECGKGYKHSSCLTKHLWEHTPEWSLTSKLLISKHQQVQLLEAASVLITMNNDGTTPPDSAKDFSDDSASPAASGSSDLRDGLSSADTTPPPQDMAQQYAGSYASRKRYNGSSNAFSRSYQSAPSHVYADSAPQGNNFGQYRRQSVRPASSGFNSSGQEDEAGLAAAVELLSCSFGTPRTGPVTLPADVPPVPPLPAKYLSSFSGSTMTPFHGSISGASTSYLRGRSTQEDVMMEESEESAAEDDESDARSRARSDDDEDGVFGRMDE